MKTDIDTQNKKTLTKLGVGRFQHELLSRNLRPFGAVVIKDSHALLLKKKKKTGEEQTSLMTKG